MAQQVGQQLRVVSLLPSATDTVASLEVGAPLPLAIGWLEVGRRSA